MFKYKNGKLLLEDGSQITPGNEDDSLALNRISNQEKKLPGIATLLRLGYIPILKPKEKNVGSPNHPTIEKTMSAELGSGKFGAAYEVVKDGKRYAAKITYFNNKTKTNPSEIESNGFIDGSLPKTPNHRKGLKEDSEWKPGDDEIGHEFFIRTKLEKARAQMPEEVSKHIVQHYVIEEIDFEPESGKSLVVYIMELLRPMSTTEQDLLYFGESTLKTRNYVKEYKNVEYVMQMVADYIGGNVADEIVKKPFEMYDNLTYDFFTALKKAGDRVLPQLEKWIDVSKLKKIEDLWSDVSQLLTMEIVDILDANYWRELMAKKGFNGSFSRLAMIENWVRAVLLDSFRENIDGEAKFNWTYTGDTRMDNARDKPKSFMMAMQWLADNLKIYWHDLHAGNIMMHPQTNDYVATDVGMFQL